MSSPETSVLQPTRLLGAELTSDRSGAVDPMIGREVIGQYRIEKKLGVGGMGTVYLAQQTSVSRPAVIKVLRAQDSSSADGIARFAIEARAASSLNHPNIVTIYNYGAMEDGTLFLAMEYIEGETLADRLARCGRLSVDRAVHIATQIASALGEAHARGVVHRDLKPANVMLVPRAGAPDFVKVLDFGIAKTADAGVTSTGYVVGTPRYMSPEQLLGKKLDCRSDIYSAGVVLYEMLAGVTPFQSETPMGWMHQHVEVQPKPPSTMARACKIPAPVERVVMRTLAKAPADRPPSMDMLALDLVAALNAPAEPLPPPWWRRAVTSGGRLAVAFLIAVASRVWWSLRALGRGTKRFVLTVGARARSVGRAIGSRARMLAGALGAAARRLRTSQAAGRLPAGGSPHRPPAPSAAARRPVPAPARPPVGRWASLLRTPVRRLAVALVVLIAYAGLIVALFPAVREDLGLAPAALADKPATDKPAADKTKKPPAAPPRKAH